MCRAYPVYDRRESSFDEAQETPDGVRGNVNQA
jgi:hypothetical protein